MVGVGTGRSANVIWGALLLATLIAFATLALAATAAPAGAETTTQPPPSGEVVFQDTFDRDFDSSGSTGSSGGSNPTLVPPWSRVSAAAADRVVDDPLARAGRSSAKFTVHKYDVNPLTYSENPRAQLNKDNLFCRGDDRYVGFSLFFPADRFPATLGQNWMILNSFGFGPPYGDAVESTSLSLWEDRIRFRHNSQTIWERPYVRGRWVDFVVHIKFSTDPGVGFMELWVDGQKQTLANGQTIRYYQTYDPDLTACGNMQPTQYRGSGFTGMDPVVLHQDEIKVGTSYEAVATAPPDTTPPSDTTAPTVSGVSPAESAQNVDRDTGVTATFSEEMDPATLNTSTFTLVEYGTTAKISAAVSYDEAAKKATLKPSSRLAANKWYVATVKGGAGGAKDKAGDPLAADKVWYFYTDA